jgi:hypothetical protein
MRASRSHVLKRTLSTVLIACLPPAAVAGCEDDEEAPSEPAAAATSDPTFSNPAEITNPYLPLSETKKVQLAGEDDGAELVVKRTLLDRTEPFTVGGEQIEAAIVEDRAFEDGELHEVALDYYAQADDGTVYYMGEDVDNYENGKVANHEGAFRYGEETDTLGVAMPANPTVGDEFSFEDVPDVALERNTVASVGGPEALQDGTTYDDVVAIDGYVLPDEEEETKYYARDVGLIREVGPEEEVQLVDGPTAG